MSRQLALEQRLYLSSTLALGSFTGVVAVNDLVGIVVGGTDVLFQLSFGLNTLKINKNFIHCCRLFIELSSRLKDLMSRF